MMVRQLIAAAALAAVAVQLYLLWMGAQDRLQPPDTPPKVQCPALDEAAALERFQAVLRYMTVSNASQPRQLNDEQAMHDLLSYLERSYAAVWSAMAVEQVGSGGFSRLITWRGSDPSLLPVLFISHLDVVPVTPGTEADWTHPPFGGVLADGHVWGRGAADIKFSVVALLEAATGLLAAGFTPRRTVMFAFGHDEELGGDHGAGATAALLRERGVALDVVVDEGGLVLVDGLRPFTSRPVALVGVAEKGWGTLRVTLRSAGGHASQPPTDGSDVQSQMWRLTTAMALQPTPTRLAAPVTDMLVHMAPYAPRWMGPLLANADARHSWLVNRLLAFAFRRLLSRETAAMVSATLALTRAAAGVADNVLPQEALLSFNSRVLPGSHPEEVAEHLRRLMRLARVDGEVTLDTATAWAGSPVTDSSGPHFRLMRQAIQETWSNEGQDDVAVVPYQLGGGTDSKHYAPLSRGGVLRFVPYGLNKTAGELGIYHATDERIRSKYLPIAVCTYTRMLQLFSDGVPAVADGAAAA